MGVFTNFDTNKSQTENNDSEKKQNYKNNSYENIKNCYAEFKDR
jgi:hypothetical protein